MPLRRETSSKRPWSFRAEEISVVKQQQKGLLKLLKELKALRIQNAEKDRRLVEMENRGADLEQYARINNVIVTGLCIKPQLYARVVTPGSNVFISEHLTKRNSHITRNAHNLKKNNQLENTKCTDQKLRFKLNGTPQLAKIVVIWNMKNEK